MNHDLVIFKFAYVRNQAANFDKTVAFYITHTHTQPFNGPFPGLPGQASTRKVKPIWTLLKQETVVTHRDGIPAQSILHKLNGNQCS